VSQFKSNGAARGTVCTLSHNITQLESRKGRSAAPPGQLRGRSESQRVRVTVSSSPGGHPVIGSQSGRTQRDSG
jgi:hypothetical protein